MLCHRLTLSIQHPRTDIGAMDGGVAARRPARATAHEAGVIQFSNHNLARANLHLGVAFQAKVIVPLHEQLLVDRTVGRMTRRATVAQRFVLEGERSGLFPMTLRARFVEPRHGQSARRFENVAPVGIMAIHAIHSGFHDRMVMWQVELRVNFQMALVTTRRVFARVHDELSPAASRRNVFAPGPMTGFAARHAGPLQIVLVKPAMRAGRKNTRDVGVAVRASPVSDKGCSLDLRRHDHGSVQRRARTECQSEKPNHGQSHGRAQTPCLFAERTRMRLHRYAKSDGQPMRQTGSLGIKAVPRAGCMNWESAGLPLFFKP